MSDDAPTEYYTEERWHNWIDRLREERPDPEDEDAARMLFNMQDDTALALVKIVGAHEDGELAAEAAVEEITEVHGVVWDEVPIEDDETAELIDDIRLSLDPVFYGAEQYVTSGPVEDATVEGCLRAAAEAESEEDMDAALGFAAQAGTLIFDGKGVDPGLAEELEYGYVTEWINGLNSLERATSDPEFVEE
ncbi:DUF2150 domain-containing protein [Halobacteriales archaeon SW_7_68_16]|nr:MAG: DUF2150 domain-containing protein [Halobacteriales archaeon SW_7_68_16]